MPEAVRGERRLHLTIAEADGAGVVLIPGLGSGMKLFGTLPRRFAKDGLRTVAFDPVGVPPSSPLDGPFDFDAAADDVFAVADAAGLSRVHLVGTSLGGKVALAAAARHPERVERIVMLASACVTSPRSRRVYRYFEAVAEHLPEDRFADAVAPFLFGRAFQDARDNVVEDIARATRPPEATRRLMVAQARALREWDGIDTAHRVAAPTLCVAGGQDTLTDVVDVERTAAILDGGRVLLLPDAGHSLLLETADAYRSTLEFLRGA